MTRADAGDTMIRIRPPARTWLFAGLMAIALAAAAAAGLVLGLLAGTRTGVGDGHWTQTVQSHGRVQLWVFAVILVTTLVLEFLVRFNGRPARSPRARIAIAALLGGGAILGSVSGLSPWAGRGLGVVGALTTLAGSLLFAGQVLRVRPIQPVRADLHPLFFAAGAAWLIAGASFALVGAWRVIGDMVPLAETRAMHELILRGFILSTIVGVTLRALPGHAGTRPVPPRDQAVVFVLLEAGLALWLLGSGALFESAIDWALRAGNIFTAAGFVFYTISTGLFAPKRLFARDLVNQMIRWAWAGGLVWAALLAWAAVADVPMAAYREGAIRHVFMLGFMAPLILAFAHVVLARFGAGLIPWRKLLTTGFILLLGAWPLRAAAGFVSEPADVTGRAMMGVAGFAAIAGLGLAAVVTGKTAWYLAHPKPRAFRRADVVMMAASTPESRRA